jgi:hypothetical protein
MKTLAVLVLLAAMPAGGAAAGGRGHDQDDDCFVPMADWQPRDAVERLAAENAWTIRRIKVDDGCYAIIASDAGGRRIEVKVDPATLEVIEIEHDDDDDGGRRDRDGHRN